MQNDINNNFYSKANIKYDILRAYSSYTYQRLNDYYRRDNIFSIIGKCRDENVHTNFLCWLFDHNSSHNLGIYPIQMLLRVIDYIKTKRLNNSAYIPECFDDYIRYCSYICDVDLYREFIVTSEAKTNRRIDLIININYLQELNLPQLRIVVENKVNSTEHDEQTVEYYERTQLKKESNVEYVYIFLTPAPNGVISSLDKQQCESPYFIQINYQTLLDYIIQPCLNRCASAEAKFYLDNYIRCLGDPMFFEENNVRGVIVMAVSDEENKLLRTFWDENEKLIKAAINSVLNDEGHSFSNNEIESMEKVIQIDTKSKSKKFSFNGKKLALNNIVLEFIKFYISENPNVSYDELCSTFPKSIQGCFGVIKKADDLTDSDKGMNRINKQPNFFLNDQIELNDGCKIVVCNQWGAGGNGTNFFKFLDVVYKLNYREMIKELT